MRYLAVILLCLWGGVVSAGVDPAIWGETSNLDNLDRDFDDPGNDWKEVQTRLPPYPRAEDLVEFPVSATTSNRYFIDYATLNVGGDGVVRYSVQVRSPSGAETVSFEGLRCETGERKLYAFGHRLPAGGGEWSRNRFAKWDPIAARQANSYQRELFFYYLCAVETAGDLNKIHYAIKHGGIKRD